MLDLSDLPGPDESAAGAVRARAAQVLRPTGALARLDEVAAWLAGWQRTTRPHADRPAVVVFVADHGVAVEGVSAYPAGITVEMMDALRAGVATAAVMARSLGARLDVVDVGAGRPTANLTVEAALSPARFDEGIASGRAAVAAAAERDPDVLVLGEMGIGNTTAAAGVCAALFGGTAEDWTGRGTGIDDDALAHKVEVVDAARRRVGSGGPVTPLEVLRHLGGAELAAIAGATVEARRRSLPVVLDGFVVTAAVAPLALLRADALDHVIAGHCSGESGHRLLLDKLGLDPLLDLGLRLGEASGALAALPLLRLAATCVSDVATFDEWRTRDR
jgi:nicotinate-nucleotide--dimethylbenzimidazole phosphoribosyltransferase